MSQLIVFNKSIIWTCDKFYNFEYSHFCQREIALFVYLFMSIALFSLKNLINEEKIQDFR